MARNVGNLKEKWRRMQIDVSQDTQEHMYGADYGHKSEF
tara:strand:- start:178 stop:294 length:117 start_codon:yes stop_codon:yes gene_type:complete